MCDNKNCVFDLRIEFISTHRINKRGSIIHQQILCFRHGQLNNFKFNVNKTKQNSVQCQIKNEIELK